jgi:hypothetical protein
VTGQAQRPGPAAHVPAGRPRDAALAGPPARGVIPQVSPA